MSRPEFVVAASARTAQGSLLAADLERVSRVLQRGGFVLLPSDTAYSVAVLPLTQDTRVQLNELLERPDQPLSLAFPDVASSTRWAAPNRVAAALLQHFSPGPITVVTRASFKVPAQVVDKALGGRNSTIGFRIPSSATERSVAAALDYPITTTAVFVAGVPVTTFGPAREFVEGRVDRTSFPCWCAIDGVVQVSKLSTVVRVTSEGRVDEIRAGAIPISEIEAQRIETLREQP